MHSKYIKFLFFLGLIGVAAPLSAQINNTHIWVNEFHYDEMTLYGESDENEFIELVVSNQILDDPAEAAKVKLVLYTAGGVGLDNDPNFAKGLPYHEASLLYSEEMSVHPIADNNADGSGNNFQKCTPDGANYSFLSKDLPALQDMTAGFAIIYDDQVVAQFISYEGTFKACACPAAGAAAGMTTTLIDAPAETTDTPDDHSIYLTGTGNKYEDFSWNGALLNTESKCDENAGQNLSDLPCIAPSINDPGTLTASCVSTFTLPAITGSFLSGNEAYFDNTQASGTANMITEVTEATTVYIFDSNGTDCNQEVAVMVEFESGIDIAPITEGLTACDALTLPAITGTAVTTNAAYFTETGGMGDRFEVGDVITTSMNLFAYEGSSGCSDEEAVSFTVNTTPTLTDIPNGTHCDGFTLPTISGMGAYFTETGGAGMQLTAGSEITESGTYFIFADNNGCTAEESFIINITPTPVITAIGDQQECDAYVLPAIEGTNLSGTSVTGYYTASGGPMGSGTKVATGTTIETTTTLFRYDAVGECSTEEEIVVTILEAAMLAENITNQTTCEGTNDGSITVTPSGGTSADGNYDYEWNTGFTSTGSTGTLANLAANEYTVMVTDDEGCTRTASYTVECTEADALSVDLLAFTAELSVDNHAILNWQTANENNFSHFEVLRSNDGKQWTNLGEVAAENSSYQYMDKKLLTKFRGGTLLFYQLKMVNQDGSAELSAIRTVGLPNVADQLAIYPNPTNGALTVSFATEQTQTAQLRVLSVTGKLVQQIDVQNPAVANQQTLDLSTLPRGVYFVELRLAEGTQQQKVILE